MFSRSLEPPSIPTDAESFSEAANLFYADFPGNREIAIAIGEELRNAFRINLIVSSADYDEITLCRREELRSAFRLVLIASPWPHPISMLTADFFSVRASEKFSNAFRRAANENCLESAAALASSAEDVLIAEGTPIVIVGRAIGCLRARGRNVWCPPSGWIDYSAFADN